MFWSRKRPYAKAIRFSEVVEPITINKDDYEELRFLVLEFQSEYGTLEYWGKYGMDILNLTTESFRPFGFHKGSKYEIKVTIFSENSKPVSKRFELKWDGNFNFEECIKEI